MYLTADTGGTTIRVEGFATLDPTTRLERTTFRVSRDDFLADYNRLVEACHQIAGGEPIEAFGLAVAGKVSDDRGWLLGAGNLTHWVGRPLSKMLIRDLGCPVVLGNDAEAAALAEALYGYGAGFDFWFFIWGTGVGGTLVRRRGGIPLSFPSEVGHQVVEPYGRTEPLCGCGRYGCLESVAGGRSLIRFGRPVADLLVQQWDEVVEWMTTGVYNALIIQPAPLVVFGGGVAVKQPHLLPKIERQLRDQAGMVKPPVVRLSAFGEGAGTIGALALLSQEDE